MYHVMKVYSRFPLAKITFGMRDKRRWTHPCRVQLVCEKEVGESSQCSVRASGFLGTKGLGEKETIREMAPHHGQLSAVGPSYS